MLVTRLARLARPLLRPRPSLARALCAPSTSPPTTSASASAPSAPSAPVPPQRAGLLAHLLSPAADGSPNRILSALGYYSDESLAIGAATTLYAQALSAATALTPAPERGSVRAPFTARFEMLELHVYLVIRRLRGEKGREADVARGMQTLFDVFWTDVRNRMLIQEEEITLIPSGKWIKECEQRFFGLALALDDCVEMARGGDVKGGENQMREVLSRNITCLGKDERKVRELADYVANCLVLHSREPLEKIWEDGLPYAKHGK